MLAAEYNVGGPDDRGRYGGLVWDWHPATCGHTRSADAESKEVESLPEHLESRAAGTFTQVPYGAGHSPCAAVHPLPCSVSQGLLFLPVGFSQREAVAGEQRERKEWSRPARSLPLPAWPQPWQLPL